MEILKDTTRLYVKVRQKHGAISEIARRAGYHRNYVRSVLKGQYENIDILETAARYVQELDERHNKVYELIRVAV